MGFNVSSVSRFQNRTVLLPFHLMQRNLETLKLEPETLKIQTLKP